MVFRSLTSDIEWNVPTILFIFLGSTCALASGLLLSNNEAKIIQDDTEQRLMADTTFLVRGLGSEVAMLAALMWCSVLNGHSRALARWFPVGLIPNIWMKLAAGMESAGKTNLVIGLVVLYFGWAGKSATPAKRFDGATILFIILGSMSALVSGLLLSNNEAKFVQDDTEARLFADNAFLVRAIGSEVAMLAAIAWCSVLNGHSRAVARWWAVGLLPNIWIKFAAGAEGGAKTNLAISLVLLCFGWAGKAADPAKKAA